MKPTTERVGKMKFRVTNPESGRSQDVFIPGADRMDSQRLENLVTWQTEETAKELASPELPHRPMSKTEQHELGKELIARQAADKRRRETGKRKYF